MIRSRQYVFRPLAKQREILHAWRRQCCELYNNALEHRITSYRRGGIAVTRYDQQKELTQIRSELLEYKNVPALVQRSALQRLDEAYKAFFQRVKRGEKPGFPRFRSCKRYDSFSIGRCKIHSTRSRQHSSKSFFVDVPKLGPVRFKVSGNLLNGELRDIILRYDGIKDCWLISITWILPDVPKRAVSTDKAVGIDLGLTSFAVLNDGTEVENPRFFKKNEESLSRAQRMLSRKVRGSRSRQRAKRAVGLVHRRTANRRKDFHIKLSRELVQKYDLIAHENLNIKGLAKGFLAKSVHDVGWAQFITILGHKAEEAGVHLIAVNPKNTTKACSGCQTLVHKEISQRIHKCESCGLELGRDHNAAKNILARGLRAVSSNGSAMESVA